MARFLHLSLGCTPRGRRFSWAGIATAFVLGGAVLHAQSMMEETAKTSAPPAAPKPAPAKPTPPAAPQTAAKPGTPPAPPATPPAPLPPIELDVDRYGKILGPGDEPLHPIKASQLPFPGIGEVKIPNANDVMKRQKLEQLAGMSDDDIRKQLADWPAFSKMTLADEGTFLQRIQQFRDYRMKQAESKQHQLGLLTLNPAQAAKFRQEYWDKRLQADQQLAKQFEQAYKDRMTKLDQELFSEFSSMAQPPLAAPPVAPGPKPPAPPPPAKPPTTAANPMVAQPQ